MSEAQDFYDLASALAAEGVGDGPVAPMGFGQGDPGEARTAIARYRVAALVAARKLVAE